MYPKNFVEEARLAKQLSELRDKIWLFLGFFGSLFVLGPLIHELGHVLVLFMEGCSFDSSFGFSLMGMHGSIQPLCDLSSGWLLLFYSSGYLATILFGGLLCLYSVNLRDNDFLSYFLSVVGIGSLLSILLSIGNHGDVYLFVGVLGLYETMGHLATLFLALGVSATCLRVLEVVFRQQD